MAISITFTADNPAEVVSVTRLRLYTGSDYATGLAYDITGGAATNGSYTFTFNTLASGTYYPLATVVYTDGSTSDVALAVLVYPPSQSFSYSGDPSSSTKDQVRFLLGDTDSTDPLLTDQAINFLVIQWSDVYSAAAAGAEQIAGQFAREVTYSGDGVGVDFSSLQQKYMLLAGQLRTLGKRLGRLAVPYVGGMSKSDTLAAQTNDDIELTLFAVGMHDDFREGGSDVTNFRNNDSPLLSDQSGTGG